MKSTDYLIIVASKNENMKLANEIKTKLKELNSSSLIINIVDENLPMYTSMQETNEGIPSSIIDSIEQMKKVKGYIFVSPEYNYTIPPTLTNYIAWISRVGDDFREVFTEKPVLNATFSGGGGSDVLNSMRTQFTKLGSHVMPREILANYSKPLNINSLEKTLKQLIKFSS